jgi:hypothetical protein
MIDFPITDVLDADSWTLWLEHHLHPGGLQCPHCGSSERRLVLVQGHFPAYRCRVYDGYNTLLTGTGFAKTRRPPATLVLLRRGIAKGEPTARLACELVLSRQPLNQTWPTPPLPPWGIPPTRGGLPSVVPPCVAHCLTARFTGGERSEPSCATDC